MATVFGALYVAMLSFHVRLGRGATRSTPPFHPRGEQGWSCSSSLRWSYDTGAYPSARASDGRISTHISPAKTIEG
jgi:hypothetical protein